MSETQSLNKEQILKAIEKLEKNPHDKLGILSDIGVGAVGAASAGVAASIFGGSAIFFGLFPIAAPLAVVAGGAALGGLALVGAKRIVWDGTSIQGKKAEMLKQLKENLREVEVKERASKLEDSDIKQFYSLLKDPVDLELISLGDAQDLIVAVQSGKISLKEAYQLVQDLI